MYLQKISKILSFAAMFTAGTANAQYFFSDTGITGGISHYTFNSDYFDTKGGTGFNIGLCSSYEISDNSKLIFEGYYSSNKSSISGREDLQSPQEMIDIKINSLNMGVVFDYDILHYFDDDLMIGINAGPTFMFVGGMKPADDRKEFYLLGSTDYTVSQLHDFQNKIKVFGSLGASAQYGMFELSLRYYKGFTQNFREFTHREDVTFGGKDNFINLSLTIYFLEGYY